MTQKTLECGNAPAIKIEIHGDARIEGWEKNEIRAEGDAQIELTPAGDAINLTCNGDCEVMVPRGAAVAVMAIGGDARVRDITGSVALGAVGGDCSIKRVTMLDIQTVGGDADLSCERLGAVRLNAGGDAKLGIKTGPLQPFTLQAGGDIECKLPPVANARVSITDGAGSRALVLGDGSVAVALACGGDAHLAGENASRGARGADFNFDFGKEFAQGFGPNFGKDFGKRISEQLEVKMRQQAEKMAQKATRHAERAAHRAEAQAERMARHAERKSWRGFGFGVSLGDDTPAPQSATSYATEPGETVSDEERMTILRMLADKKITAEQADQLLNALA